MPAVGAAQRRSSGNSFRPLRTVGYRHPIAEHQRAPVGRCSDHRELGRLFPMFPGMPPKASAARVSPASDIRSSWSSNHTVW